LILVVVPDGNGVVGVVDLILTGKRRRERSENHQYATGDGDDKSGEMYVQIREREEGLVDPKPSHLVIGDEAESRAEVEEDVGRLGEEGRAMVQGRNSEGRELSVCPHAHQI
jgi:hypothetical protein